MPRIQTRLLTLERQFGKPAESESMRRWLTWLDDWPSEWIASDGDVDVTPERIAEIKSICRDVARRIRAGNLPGGWNDLRTIFALAKMIPAEALEGACQVAREMRNRQSNG